MPQGRVMGREAGLRSHIEERVGCSVGPMVVKSNRPFRRASPRAILYTCADGRFTAEEDEVLAGLGFVESPDRQAPPGGPGAIHEASAMSHQSRMVLVEHLAFLIEGHQTERIVLVSHEDCAYYAHRYRFEQPEQRRERQLRDILEVERDLRRRFGFGPGAVECFYQQPEDGYAAFRRVAAAD